MNNMKNKQQLGQFFTKNADYIIGDLIGDLVESDGYLNSDQQIIDPFAGDCDLLYPFDKFEALDIDPKHDNVKKNDSLLNPIDYTNKWVITNPPWLAKNKNKNDENEKAYKKYNTNDLYKCAMLSIKEANGGIIIVPLNFWCEEQKSTRSDFLNTFIVKKVKVFEEQIFKDTSYTACAFSFINKKLINNSNKEQLITFQFWKGSKIDNDPSFKESMFMPGTKYLEKTWLLKEKNNYSIGDEYIEFIKNNNDKNIFVGRFIKNDKPWNTLVLHAQDTGTNEGKVKLKYEEKTHIDTTKDLTDRVIAGIKILKNGKPLVLNKKQQLNICKLFNDKLEEFRAQYNSMCLTNYRNSTTTLARKRISFDAAYCIIRWALKEIGEG